MARLLLPITILGAVALVQVSAWGELGHQLVSRVAYELLNPTARAQVDALLQVSRRNTPWTLDAASTWADAASHSPTHAYDWSKRLHYVDVGGEDEHKCFTTYVEERDCPGGACVIGALANYTTRLASCAPLTTTPLISSMGKANSPSTAEADGPPTNDELRAEALRFVLHFAGDIAQPLHATGRARGGNSIKVSFDGKSRNLHAVWDSQLVQRHLELTYRGSKEEFVAAAVRDIRQATTASSRFHAHMPRWTQCYNRAGNNELKASVHECAVQWASESNLVACNQAFPLYDKTHADSVNVHVEAMAKARAAVQGTPGVSKKRPRSSSAVDMSSTSSDNSSEDDDSTMDFEKDFVLQPSKKSRHRRGRNHGRKSPAPKAPTPTPTPTLTAPNNGHAKTDLANAYFEAVRSGVELAIVGAGVRLAELLNRALTRCNPSAVARAA